jgi:hypothetical protein
MRKKEKDTEEGLPDGDAHDGDETLSDGDEEGLTQRRVFVNLPLPDELLDEDGLPKQHFSRNKIRTAKYTPLIFIPKNLWLQFHNIANIYFLFVTILAVRHLDAPCTYARANRSADIPYLRCK